MSTAYEARIDRLTARIDRVHSDIKRNPWDRGEIAPFLRQLEARLSDLVECGPCDHTAEGGYECAREKWHEGAHFAATGEWWSWPWEGKHYRFSPYAPLAA